MKQLYNRQNPAISLWLYAMCFAVDSGDTPGKPPRLSFIPDHLKIIDNLLEKASYEKRLYTASLWRQTSEDGILPTYLSLIDPANDRLVTMSYSVLGLSRSRR